MPLEPIDFFHLFLDNTKSAGKHRLEFSIATHDTKDLQSEG